MANILISHFSTIVENGRFTPGCFFEGLAKSFQEGGHNVKHMISTSFIPKPWNGTNTMYKDVKRQRLIQDIRDFSPDLCIFANNSVPEAVYEATDCPVIILLSDTAAFLNDKELIKNKSYGNRIHFYAPFKRDIHEIETFFGKDAGKILHLLPATSVEAETIPVDKNISFIGSNFQNDKRLENLILDFPDRKRLLQILSIIRHNTSLPDILSEKEANFIESYLPTSHFIHMFSARDRILTLSLMTEEGLSLYGATNWHETSQHFPDIAASFDQKKVYSLKHNQDIYNSSKICLSVSHSQASDGFPWRIMDIMASNGCLLSDRKQGIADFSKDYVDIPMYESPLEARELARRLLKDEILRKEIIDGSQRCIAENGLWKHRFNEIEQQTGVKLTLSAPRAGTISYISGEDYSSIQKRTLKTKSYLRRGLAKVGRHLARL